MPRGRKGKARRKEEDVQKTDTTDDKSISSLIHEHRMIPWNDLSKCKCCNRLEAISDGYYCKSCDFFVHKTCCKEALLFIQHPYHPLHSLRLQTDYMVLTASAWIYSSNRCDLCGCYRDILYGSYSYSVDFFCAKYPPPEIIENSERHGHKLTLVKELIEFDCSANCEKNAYGYHYKCDECDLAFHVECGWHPPELNQRVKHATEINHPYHSLHPLKLLTGQPPVYSDGKCRLCGRTIDEGLFNHCSSCDITLDMRCVLNPPPQTLLDLKTHDHQLTLLPRLDTFTCNACGLKGDRSPYVCIQCDFVIHQDCLALPRVININRHNHRVYRTYVLRVVNSVCKVCHKKVENWTRGVILVRGVMPMLFIQMRYQKRCLERERTRRNT